MAGETPITVIGNLVQDPELRNVGKGIVCDFRIASTPRTYNRTSQQWEDGSTLFLTCSAWDSQYQTLASNIKATLSKGMRVIVQGNLTSRSYTAQDGSQRTVFEIHVNEIGPAREPLQLSPAPAVLVAMATAQTVTTAVPTHSAADIPVAHAVAMAAMPRPLHLQHSPLPPRMSGAWNRRERKASEASGTPVLPTQVPVMMSFPQVWISNSIID